MDPTEWIEVDFGSGNEKQINKLRMHFDGYSAWAPSAFILKGSNTGAFGGEETDIMTESGFTPQDLTWHEWEFGGSTSYRYYRIHITDYNDGSDEYCTIGEVEMMEYA